MVGPEAARRVALMGPVTSTVKMDLAPIPVVTGWPACATVMPPSLGLPSIRYVAPQLTH